MADKPFENVVDTLQIYADTAEEETGVPADLILSVIHSESSFKPNKRSKAGAVGLMQLMPAVAKQYGVTDPLDPVQNIRAGAKYLADLLERYNGNQELALAAYHAGPTNVYKAGGRVPDSEVTQKYVRQTMQNYADPGNLRRLYGESRTEPKLPKERVRELVR